MAQVEQPTYLETQEEMIARIIEERLAPFRHHWHRTFGMHNIILGNPLWHPYYWTDIQEDLGTTGNFVGTIYIHPIYFQAPMTISQMTCNITFAGGPGTSIRLGLYADNGGTPAGGALLFDSGNINANVTGPINAAFPAPLARPKGISTWVAIQTDSAIVNILRCARDLGWNEIGLEMINGCSFAQAFGAFTNPCPVVTGEIESRFWGFVRVDSVQPL